MAKKTPKKADDPARRLRRVVKDGVVCMLTTATPEGALHSRPIRTSRIEPDGNIYLVELAGSAPAAVDDAKVGLSYFQRKNARYVSISGVASQIRDLAAVEDMWKSRFKPWFPEGTSLSDTALLRIQVQKVDYWELDQGSTVAFAERPGTAESQAPLVRAPTAGAQG